LAGQYADADRVIVDAPCSAIGVVRRRIDLKWRLQAEQIEELARLQAKILHRASECVRTGGILLYSTCTLTRRENVDVVKDFLDTHTDFTLDAEVLPALRKYMLQEQSVQIFPGDEKMDGFFIARLRRF
jgi:16S rRNA (cytosine967-C5)-methyltransferase